MLPSNYFAGWSSFGRIYRRAYAVFSRLFKKLQTLSTVDALHPEVKQSCDDLIGLIKSQIMEGKASQKQAPLKRSSMTMLKLYEPQIEEE